MKLILLLLGVILIHPHGFGQPAAKLTVDADKPLCVIQPTMWGLFFEDINFASDGGLYAELVKNRSFEFPDPLEGWAVEGATFFSSPVQIINRIAENEQNPRIARIRVKDSVCMVNAGELVDMEDMEPYLQDALDLIELANGPLGSRWGRIRAELGHPEPFHLKYLGIGNEQWGTQYFERYALFEQLLDKWYPEIRLISSTGPMASGPLFDYNRNALKDFTPALVDEHNFNSPDWFFSNVTRYDDYDRNTYKIFAGEYAAANVRMASPENENVRETALAEAADCEARQQQRLSRIVCAENEHREETCIRVRETRIAEYGPDRHELPGRSGTRSTQRRNPGSEPENPETDPGYLFTDHPENQTQITLHKIITL
jgi:hypothetical protein